MDKLIITVVLIIIVLGATFVILGNNVAPAIQDSGEKLGRDIRIVFCGEDNEECE